jgi:NAD(P)-dependent dehydrogenase (short-subunit alcohol dehydrogenase family)
MDAINSLDTKSYVDGHAAVDDRIALVTGAGRGIGLALIERMLADDNFSIIFAGSRAPEESAELVRAAAEDSRLRLLKLDVTDTNSLKHACERMLSTGRIDLVINTVGVLHTENGMQPEKRLADINFDDMLLALDVNALSMMRLAIELEPLLSASDTPQFVSLSARVGSIEDNQLGGWYAYRASKAALNMLLRTLAIEWARKMPKISCVALHPGTVATDLSAPFTNNTPDSKVFRPAECADHLLEVIDQLGPEQNGGFYAWDGKEVPW